MIVSIDDLLVCPTSFPVPVLLTAMEAAVAVGTGTLELVLCSWPGVHVVLAMVDQINFTRSKLP
jgi:hypothetical protein